MRRAPSLFTPLLAVLLLASSAAAQHRTVRVGLHDARPVAFLDDEGEPSGFGVRIVETIAEREDWELEWIYGTWAECQARLHAGGIDLLFPILRTPRREEGFEFTEEAMFSTWGRIFARPDSRIESFLDLEGRTVVGVRDDVFQLELRDLIRRFGLDVSFVDVDSAEEVLAELVSGGADAAAMADVAGHWYLEQHGYPRMPVVFHPASPHFAAPKGSTDLVATLDENLRELKADRDSIYYDAHAEFFGAIGARGLPAWVVGALVAAAAGAFLFLGFSAVLRSQVRAHTLELSERNVTLEREIAERRRAQEELACSDERWRSVIESMPVMLNAVDERGLFAAWNKECERVTGYTADEIIGNPDALDLLYPDKDYRRSILERSTALGGDYKNWERIYVAKDGTKRIISRSCISSSFPIPGWAAWGIGIDVTEQRSQDERRRELEDQLRHSQKMDALGQIASGVAHDFRNLLTVIAAHAERIRRWTPGTHRTMESVEAMERAVEQAAGMTRSLLAFGRKLETMKEPTDLCRAVEDDARMLARMLPASIALEVDVPDEPVRPWIEADPTQLQQVLLNLAVNARDAMPSGGRLRLAVSADEEFAHLTVEDTGAGIAPSLVERVFEPYFTTKARQQGTGLGLAIVHGIVSEHAGWIAVSSKPGRGTRFSMSFPRIEAPAGVQQEAKRTEPARGEGERILVAEDDLQIRQIVTATLRARGYDVVPTKDGDELLRRFEQFEDVGLLLLDVELPGASGTDVLLELRRRGVRTPALLITASRDVRFEGDEGEGVRLLVKPFRTPELESEVAAMIGKRSAAPHEVRT